MSPGEVFFGMAWRAIGLFLGLNELGRELAKGRVEAAKVKARMALLMGGREDLSHKI